MLGKFLVSRSSKSIINGLHAVRFPSQSLAVPFSSTSTPPPTGNKNKGNNGDNNKPPGEKKVDLWQKIKLGVSNPGKKIDSTKKDGPKNRGDKNFQKKSQSAASPSDGQAKKPQGPKKSFKPRDGEKSLNANKDGSKSSTRAPQQRTGPRKTGPTGSRAPGRANASSPPFRPRRPAETSSEAGSEAGSTFGGPRRRRGAREGESTEQPSSNVSDRPREIEIAEADAALLFDDDFFVEKLRKDGGRWAIDDEEADFVDAMLSKAYLESVHTSDHSFRELYSSPRFNPHFKLPSARSMHQLRCALEPKINAPADSEGYKYASQAWTVLQRNNYYSDRQKRQIVNGIAAMVNDTLAKSKDPNLEQLDDAIDPDFYLGPEELREEVEEDLEDIDLRNKQAAAEAALRAKENAAAAEEEWSNDAVVDEDELEAMNAAKK